MAALKSRGALKELKATANELGITESEVSTFGSRSRKATYVAAIVAARAGSVKRPRMRESSSTPSISVAAHHIAEYVWWLVAPSIFGIPFYVLTLAMDRTDVSFWSFFTGADFVSRVAAARSSEHPFRKLFVACGAELFTLYGTAYIFAWLLSAVLVRCTKLRFVESPPPLPMVAKEIARSLGGVAIGTAGLAAVCLLRNADAARDRTLSVAEVFLPWALVLPLWGDFHFWAVHRALHSPVLYASYHKVHHQSVNTCSWSALSMHPFESLLYFSSLGIALVSPLRMPLFALRLLAFGLLLNPIPSHISFAPFEKSHWEHHTEFAYNYGSSQLFDCIFGTTHSAYVARRASRRNAEGGDEAAGASEADVWNERAAKEQARLARGID
jgi:sterol desaturase/sphingolipid hydroxylase (fatty acid hydroxylase superfamily)